MLIVRDRDVEAEAEAGSGTFSAEAVALKSNRFHSDQGFPTEGEFLSREEFHS